MAESPVTNKVHEYTVTHDHRQVITAAHHYVRMSHEGQVAFLKHGRLVHEDGKPLSDDEAASWATIVAGLPDETKIDCGLLSRDEMQIARVLPKIAWLYSPDGHSDIYVRDGKFYDGAGVEIVGALPEWAQEEHQRWPDPFRMRFGLLPIGRNPGVQAEPDEPEDTQFTTCEECGRRVPTPEFAVHERTHRKK